MTAQNTFTEQGGEMEHEDGDIARSSVAATSVEAVPSERGSSVTRSTPRGDERRINLWLPQEIIQEAERLAVEDDRPLSSMLKQLIRKGLEVQREVQREAEKGGSGS